MATYAELFAGIGGLSKALEMLGHSPAWFAEWDKDAAKELARNYPGVPIYGDVSTIDYAKVEPVDILVGGGWPCQPFSSAGKGLGMADPRYMWPEVARALRSLRPGIFVMENVADILDERRFPGVFSRCLADLAEAGMDARWGCLRSADVGAPHGRQRVFLIAHAQGDTRRLIDGDVLPTLADAARSRREACRSNDLRTNGARPGLGSTAPSGGETAADPESIGRDEGAGLRGSDPQGRGGGHTHNGADEAISWGVYEPAIRRWEAVMGPHPPPFIEGTRRVSPAFPAWMMGLEEPELSRSAALRCIGNAVNPLQAFVALTQLERAA